MDMNKDITPAPVATTKKRFRRTRDGKMIAGVCAGTGRYLNVDPNIIRLGLAGFTLLGGAGIALYAIAWVVIPEEGADTSVGEDLLKKAEENPQVQDLFAKARTKARETQESPAFQDAVAKAKAKIKETQESPKFQQEMAKMKTIAKDVQEKVAKDLREKSASKSA